MSNPPVPILDISDKFNGSLNMMVYGAGGTGKTEFGGSIGDKGIVLSIGDGELTFSSPGFRSRNPIKPKIAFIREEIDPKTGIFKMPPQAFDLVSDFLDWFIDSDFKYLTLDDATALNQFAKNKAISISPNFRSGAENTLEKSRKYNYPLMEMDDYQREMSMIQWLLMEHLPRINDVGKSFILVAHEKVYSSPPTNAKGQPIIGGEKLVYRVTPAFTGEKFPDNLINLFDLVWQTSVVNGKTFRMRTMPTLVYAAKTRWSGVFLEMEPSMTFLQLIKRMENS